MIRRRLLVGPSGIAVVVLVAASLLGCQALKDAIPTKPSDPKPSPSQSPVAIPVVLPTPQPTPTPILGGPSSPTPTPSPGSSPAPTPAPPSGGSCNLPPSNNPEAPCYIQTSSFLGAVDKAITQVTQQQPSLFDFGRSICENCYFVRDQGAFASAVMRNLSAAGFCSLYDGEELGVKNSNSFNEQFDILVASGHIRRGGGSYRGTCTPSWF